MGELTVVVRNYVKYGYRDVGLRICGTSGCGRCLSVRDLEYRIVTWRWRRLGAAPGRRRREGFVDVDAAVAWNAAVRARPALPREAKIEVDGRSAEELLEAIRRIAV